MGSSACILLLTFSGYYRTLLDGHVSYSKQWHSAVQLIKQSGPCCRACIRSEFSISQSKMFTVFWQMEVNYSSNRLEIPRETNPVQSSPSYWLLKVGTVGSSKQAVNFYQSTQSMSYFKRHQFFITAIRASICVSLTFFS